MVKIFGRAARKWMFIRRVDDDRSDPLELREDSRLGVPGLLHSIRSGKVAVINPPGVSALENSALLAFMQSCSKFFLQQDLLMPSIATWWCGQQKELGYVLDNLHRLIIKKANRKQKFRSVYGKTLSKEALAQLRLEILKTPHEYVAQEEVSLSTTPSLVNGKIEPRLASDRRPHGGKAILTSRTQGVHRAPGGCAEHQHPRDVCAKGVEAGLPASRSDWAARATKWKQELREQSFAGWPANPGPLLVERKFVRNASGLTLKAYDFNSEPTMRLRLYALSHTGVTKPRNVAVQLLDATGWQDEFARLRSVFGETLAEESGFLTNALPLNATASIDALRRRIEDAGGSVVLVAPRGVGLNAWSADRRREVQIGID